MRWKERVAWDTYTLTCKRMARGDVLNVSELKPGLWDNPEGRGITPVAEPCRHMVETNNIVVILQLKIIFFFFTMQQNLYQHFGQVQLLLKMVISQLQLG